MFLTFEGLDGSGKSTQVHLLDAHLRDQGHHTLRVREPGGTEVSEHIRTLLLDPALDIVPFAELLLFSAARAQLVAREIRPALADGTIVLADRFFDSTFAYQGAGRDVADLGWLRGFQERVTGGLLPDRTYYFDAPLDVLAERRNDREPDRMEGADEAFFGRVRTAYLALAEAEPDRICVLDATQPIETLHAEVLADLNALAAARWPSEPY
ncbi:MAG: dTMP kinase [Bacteroidota bacterium]